MDKIIKCHVNLKCKKEDQAYQYEATEGETIFLYTDGTWETAIRYHWKDRYSAKFDGAISVHAKGKTRSWAKDYLQKRYKLGMLNGEVLL